MKVVCGCSIILLIICLYAGICSAAEALHETAAPVSERSQLEESAMAPCGVTFGEALAENLKVTAEESARCLLWRSYQLVLDENVEVLDWCLAEDQKLPPGLMFNTKQGTIYGVVFGKQTVTVKLGLIVYDVLKGEARGAQALCTLTLQ